MDDGAGEYQNRATALAPGAVALLVPPVPAPSPRQRRQPPASAAPTAPASTRASADTGGSARPSARRPPRSRVRHGQPSCADYGCTRPGCLAAARKARRERDQERAAGRRGRVDAGPAAQHAAVLREHGMSAQDIAGVSGVSVTLIRRLLKPPPLHPPQVSQVTADAVLGVPLPPSGRPTPLAGRGQVDAAPASVLLTELAERGWPARRLAQGLCVNPHTVAAIRDGNYARISISVDQRIRALHAALLPLDPVAAGVRPGDAARVRTWAARRRETPPAPHPGLRAA
ncbi:hypothetical protein F7Q99_35880 [Streptomyces kaniharaensis]|uniref:Uncharacterized protein n=1 Tax=Streptomyces kaniharaensis TaxID=212423 RepID=A0A6N7L197_9ACTN|nr:hypothetical protein [Streptomyces kaniharaensis]MQS17421.1 hypothetical protein [Streptomyces kaniharaensis]